MKIKRALSTVFTVLCITIILCACAGEKSDLDNKTNDGSEKPNSENSSQNHLDEIPEVYAEILINIKNACPWDNYDSLIIPENPELSYMYCRHTELSEVGFALEDLDKNGTKELIISGIDSPFVYDLYTITDGKAKHLFDSGERYAHYLYSDGFVLLQLSGGATTNGSDFYKLNDGNLDFIERIILDTLHAKEAGLIDDLYEINENLCYFKSTSPDESDYVSITADEALAKLEEYQNNRTELKPAYIPLSEFEG